MDIVERLEGNGMDACETPMRDHVENAIKRMEAGARMILDSIPNDTSRSSSSHPADVTAELAKLLRSGQEAAAIARGEIKPARCHVPADVDVRAIRHGLRLSQEEFASEFGFTANQIRDWEQGRARPTGASRAYLIVIHSDADAVRAILKTSRDAMRRKAA